MAKARLWIEVDFDDFVTDPESLASALDTLLETALSTPEILGEYANPTFGEFLVLNETFPIMDSSELMEQQRQFEKFTPPDDADPEYEPVRLEDIVSEKIATPMPDDTDEHGTEDFCPETEGQHKADWSAVTVENDGEEVYVDVPCIHCGRSGCAGTVKLLDETVQW